MATKEGSEAAQRTALTEEKVGRTLPDEPPTGAAANLESGGGRCRRLVYCGCATDGEACSAHKCQSKKNCKLCPEVMPGSSFQYAKYCRKHLCPAQYCTNEKESDQHEACLNHTCTFKECRREVMVFSKACQKHACKYSEFDDNILLNCLDPVHADGQEYCRQHTTTQPNH